LQGNQRPGRLPPFAVMNNIEGSFLLFSLNCIKWLRTVPS
jgi:hypothetical protein